MPVPPRIFLLSPARLDGERARLLFHPAAIFPLAWALHSVLARPSARYLACPRRSARSRSWQRFLRTQAGITFLARVLPKEGHPHFEGSVVALDHLLISSDDAGMFFGTEFHQDHQLSYTWAATSSVDGDMALIQHMLRTYAEAAPPTGNARPPSAWKDNAMTAPKPLELMTSPRFAPLFWTQFLGGFNDNFLKQAMALLIAYRIGAASGLDPAALTALAGATFVAPFILFSALAGRLADTMDKATLARRLKVMEIALMALAVIALLAESLLGLFAVLFLLGLQAALFGPVKYSLLPAHLSEHELSWATR